MPAIFIISWIVAGLATALNFAAQLTLSIHPTASFLATMASEADNAAPNNNNNAEPALQSALNDNRLSLEAGYLLRAVSVAGLIIATAAAAVALSRLSPDWLIWLALALGLFYKVSSGILISFLIRRHLSRLRRWLLPLVFAFNRIASAGLVKKAASYSSNWPGGRQIYYLEVADFIKTGLSYLARVHIPQEEKELRMIRGILRMDTVKVSEIMCPRPDIVALQDGATYAEAIEAMQKGGVTKLPIYSESLDNVNNIKGVLFALDLLSAVVTPKGGDLRLTDFWRPPLFVTEFQNVEGLLREFKQQRTTIALVVDEHGGVDGLVTVTDVIEEIIGEMMDEFDRDLPEIQTVSPREVVADAAVSLDQLNQALGSDLKGDVNSVGGLIFSRLGKIPRTGDVVNIGPVRIMISNMIGRRIRRVKVTLIDKPPLD